MITLTASHKNLLILVDKNEKLIEDTLIIKQFDLTTWLELWREGYVLTDPNGLAYLTPKGRAVAQQLQHEELL